MNVVIEQADLQEQVSELSNEVHDKATSGARAARLKRLRNLSNMTLKQMCADGSINFNTLTGWERALHGGLTVKGAKKVIARVADAGVMATVDWLMYEIGEGPKLVTQLPEEVSSDGYETLMSKSDSKYVIAEVNQFKKNYANAIDLVVQDNAMTPHYKKGDYIAGVRLPKSKYKDFIGQNVIALLDDGEKICRMLVKGKKNRFYLVAKEINGDTPYAVIEPENILDIATVIWHRKVWTV